MARPRSDPGPSSFVGADRPAVLTERLVWTPRVHAPPLEIDLREIFAKAWH